MVLVHFICPTCKKSSFKHSHTEYKTQNYYCYQSSVQGKIVEKYFCVDCKIHLQYLCPKCKAISPSYESHLQHFMGHLVIKCPFCTSTFKKEKDLYAHQNRIHVEELKKSLTTAKKKRRSQSKNESSAANIPSTSQRKEPPILERVAEIIAQISVPTTVSGRSSENQYFNQEPLPGTSYSRDYDENFTTFNPNVVPSEESNLCTTSNKSIPTNIDIETAGSSNNIMLPPTSGKVMKSGKNSSGLSGKDVTESNESNNFLHELDELTDLCPLTPSCWTDEIIESAREVTVLEILDKYTPSVARSIKTPDLVIRFPDNLNEYVVSDSPSSNTTNETSENSTSLTTDTTSPESNNVYMTSETVESSYYPGTSENVVPYPCSTPFYEGNVTGVNQHLNPHTTESNYGHSSFGNVASFHDYFFTTFGKGTVTGINQYYYSHTDESNYGHGSSENIAPFQDDAAFTEGNVTRGNEYYVPYPIEYNYDYGPPETVEIENRTEFIRDDRTTNNENTEDVAVNVEISNSSETDWIDKLILSNQEFLQTRNLLDINDLFTATEDFNNDDPINTIFSRNNEHIQICKSPTALPTVNDTDGDIENNYLRQALVDLIQLSPEQLPDRTLANIEKMSANVVSANNRINSNTNNVVNPNKMIIPTIVITPPETDPNTMIIPTIVITPPEPDHLQCADEPFIDNPFDQEQRVPVEESSTPSWAKSPESEEALKQLSTHAASISSEIDDNSETDPCIDTVNVTDKIRLLNQGVDEIHNQATTSQLDQENVTTQELVQFPILATLLLEKKIELSETQSTNE